MHKKQPYGPMAPTPEKTRPFQITREGAAYQLELFEFDNNDANQWAATWAQRTQFDGNYLGLIETALAWDAYAWEVNEAIAWFSHGYLPDTAYEFWVHSWTVHQASVLRSVSRTGNVLAEWLLIGASPAETIRLAGLGFDPFTIVMGLREGFDLETVVGRLQCSGPVATGVQEAPSKGRRVHRVVERVA